MSYNSISYIILSFNTVRLLLFRRGRWVPRRVDEEPRGMLEKNSHRTLCEKPVYKVVGLKFLQTTP